MNQLQRIILLTIRHVNKCKAKRVNKAFYRHVNRISENTIPNGNVYFFPEVPPSQAVLKSVLRTMGYRITDDPELNHDIAISWEDGTYKNDISHMPGLKNAWNSKCLDISKSKVDEVFSSVFNYSSLLSPDNHDGWMLEKSEINGSHDARIIRGPVTPRKNYIYQKVINNKEGRFLYKDIRLVYIKGEIPFAYLNYRSEGKRFSVKKFKSQLAAVDACISADEIANIIRFAQKMNIDYAEIDLLRDNNDKRLYIIDVNTTAHGPGTGLNRKEKMQALEYYREAMRKALQEKGQ